MTNLSIKILLATFLFFNSGTAQELRVHESARYLEYETGEPFLWIGDTAWDLFHDLDREEATYYLENRAEKKFTVIQAVVLAENNGLRKPNAYGEVPLINLDPTTPNENYFEHVDFIVNKAEELGLYIGMLPTWGDKVFSNNPGAGPIVFNKDNAAVYGEFLGNRYKDKPIIWILGGDRNPANEEVEQIWEAMALGLRKGDGGNHLITYHPRGGSSSSRFFHEKEWLDFNMYQSGHGGRFSNVYRYARSELKKEPPKPFVDGEPGYEDIPIAFWEFVDFSKQSEQRVPKGVLNEDLLIQDESHFEKGFLTDYDVRVSAYWNFLSGAAGYTYGNNAVWQIFRKKGEVAIPALYDWKESLDRPGADDMKHLAKLFSKRPHHTLMPGKWMIVGEDHSGGSHVQAAMDKDRKYVLYYLAVGQPMALRTSFFEKGINAYWFNPRNGEITEIKDFITQGGISGFRPPTWDIGNDWVLVIDNKNAKLPKLE